MKSKSNKAFEHNIKAEMHAGKPQKQSLAIAFSVQRKAKKKKMADGGQVPQSAKTERRPMPDQRGEQTARNSGNKPAKMDAWTDRPDIKQSQKGPKTTRIKHPSMAQSPVFKVRMRDQEDDLEQSAAPASPEEQPPRDDDEESPDRQGPKVRDMADEHSTHRKPYAKGGEIESSDYDHTLDGEYEDDLTDLPPSEDEGMEMADSHDEEDQEMKGNDVPDMEREHSNGRKPYARGGEVSPDDEIDMDHEDSIAAAIMARRDRLHAEIDSGAHDLDEAVRMAEGGEVDGLINGMDSIYAHPDEDQADLRRNAEEDANMEDQSSFNALRKENYSESEGLDELDNPSDSGQKRPKIDMDDHDMVDKIRRKAAAKRQFKAR